MITSISISISISISVSIITMVVFLQMKFRWAHRASRAAGAGSEAASIVIAISNVSIVLLLSFLSSSCLLSLSYDEPDKCHPKHVMKGKGALTTDRRMHFAALAERVDCGKRGPCAALRGTKGWF